jgi:hypothetical protein
MHAFEKWNNIFFKRLYSVGPPPPFSSLDAMSWHDRKTSKMQCPGMCRDSREEHSCFQMSKISPGLVPARAGTSVIFKIREYLWVTDSSHLMSKKWQHNVTLDGWRLKSVDAKPSTGQYVLRPLKATAHAMADWLKRLAPSAQVFTQGCGMQTKQHGPTSYVGLNLSFFFSLFPT